MRIFWGLPEKSQVAIAGFFRLESNFSYALIDASSLESASTKTEASAVALKVTSHCAISSLSFAPALLGIGGGAYHRCPLNVHDPMLMADSAIIELQKPIIP